MLIQVTPVLEQLPRPRVLCWEETDSTDYYFAGAARDGIVYSLFQYTLQGRGIFTAGGHVHHLTPGKGFLCYVRDPAYAYYMPKDATEPWRFVYVQMMGEPTRLMVEDLVDRFGYVYDLPADRGSMLRYQEWIRDGHNVFSATEAMGVVTDLFADLIASKESASKSRNESHLIRRAMEVIDQRMDQPLTATGLAAELRVSREYLSRLFRANLGKSPYRYLLDYKITHSAQRLRQTTDSIKEIAFAYGFSSPELFCKAFRKSMGLPPSRYRKGQSE